MTARRESDLLAFEIGVKDGGVQSVMCSYNLLNALGLRDPYLLTQVLKTDWASPDSSCRTGGAAGLGPARRR